jgi:hypothetical protein
LRSGSWKEHSRSKCSPALGAGACVCGIIYLPAFLNWARHRRALRNSTTLQLCPIAEPEEPQPAVPTIQHSYSRHSSVVEQHLGITSGYGGLPEGVLPTPAHSNAAVLLNTNNPIWQTVGNPSTQIVIPGVASAAQISNANTNLFEHFTVNSTNPYLYNNANGT